MPIPNPTYRAEMNFSNDLTGYAVVGSAVVGTDRIGGEFADVGFVNLQSRLLGFQTLRGREDDLAGVTAGTIRADLDDGDGALDPDNTASPYSPNIKLMRRLRVVAAYNGVDYGLGYGFVTNYQAAPVATSATVAVQASDLFIRMGRPRPPIAYPEQRFDERIHALLDQLQWPRGRMRALDVSTLTVPAATIGTDTTMLAHIDTALKAERGLFFMSGSGAVVYHSRHRRLGTSSRGTFGAGGLPIAEIQPVYNDTGIYNDVRGKRTAGVEQVSQNTASGHAYDWRTYTLPTDAMDFLPSDAAVLSLTAWLLDQRKEPVQRIASIVLDPAGDPDALWPHILGAEIGDRITVAHDVPGTRGIVAQDYFIERIEHTWDAETTGHRTIWSLSRVPTANDLALTIGHPTRGILGTGRVTY